MGYFMLFIVLPVGIGLVIAGRRQARRSKANKK